MICDIRLHTSRFVMRSPNLLPFFQMSPDLLNFLERLWLKKGLFSVVRINKHMRMLIIL